MNKETWKVNLLKYIILIGALTLAVFSVVYYTEKQFILATFEAATSVMLMFAFFWANSGKSHIGPSILGWLGVYLVLTTLLVTGGIGGVGIVWWGLIPVISFIMFGLIGGSVATFIGFLTLTSASLFTGLGFISFYFSAVEMRQAAAVVVVIGLIMYYFEKISGKAREEALVKSKLLEESTHELEFNVRALGKEKVTQENIRRAIINILEDTKEIDSELKTEKESVEKRVVERTRELAEEKAKFIASINSIDRAYVLLDLTGKVILVNNKLYDYFGEMSDGWTIKSIQVKLSDKVNLSEAFNYAVKEGKKFAVKVIESNGKYFDVHMSPIFLTRENLIGVLLMIGDITEEKTLDRSRDEFFSIASHELRTPLTAIRGNTSMIQQMYGDKVTDPDMKEMISDIHESSIRLIGIVNDFLNVSRLEMGRIEYKNENFDIVELAREVAAEIDDKKDAIELKVEFSGEVPIKVFADRDRTKEILVNLISNGVKYSEKGAVVTSFSVKEGLVDIFVKDSGRGIAPDNQKLLFHKFQQAGSSLFTRDTTKSTGLGLYISKLLAEGMKGTIWLEKSAENEGSTFAFSLPIAKN